MPQVAGNDWSDVAEQIRESSLELSPQNRINICLNLANAIKQLEDKGISHRDLSGGNIFIETVSCRTSLIDFDSLYHKSLRIPDSTTIGSEGYIAPFINPERIEDSYNEFADRFALGVLCVELLTFNDNMQVYHDGAMFNQEHLYSRGGRSIKYAKDQLRQKYPDALELFTAMINSDSFKDCPPPQLWLKLCHNCGCCMGVSSLPQVDIKLPKPIPAVNVELPENPWDTINCFETEKKDWQHPFHTLPEINGDNQNGNTTKHIFEPLTPDFSLPGHTDFGDINNAYKRSLADPPKPRSYENLFAFDKPFKPLLEKNLPTTFGQELFHSRYT